MLLLIKVDDDSRRFSFPWARPLAKLHRTLVLDFEADGNDGLEVVVIGSVVFPICGSY